MSVYTLGIDGTAAESGAKRIVKSFEDIKAAAKRMEGGAKDSFSGMAAAYKQLANMRGPASSTVNTFREFAAAINSFKGPSQANLANTKAFFSFIQSLSGSSVGKVRGLKELLDPLNNFKGPSASAANSVKVLLKAADSFKSPSSAGLAPFLAALSNFKGPSQASAKNVRTLLMALQGFTSPKVGQLGPFLSTLSGFKGPTTSSAKNTASLIRALSGFTGTKVPASFSAMLAGLASYKGPSANAGRNTLSLLHALSSFTPPKNIGSAITKFTELANAINRAGTAMSGLRGKGNIQVPNVGKASAGVRELGKNFSFLETALLRTQTAMNALGGVLGIKFIAQASNEIVKIRAQLEAATGSVQQARLQFGFVTDQANKMGLEFVSVAKSYGMLLGSIKGTNVTFAEAQKIFTGFSTAARALQLSTDDVDGVFRALGQIMSKGKLQAEELRGQLGDRLPGAFVRFAVALKMTKPGQLDDALKKGAISGNKLKEAILSVASTMEKEFAGSAAKASKTVDSAFARLKNSFTFSAAEFGANGFNAALISLADSLSKFLKSDALNIALAGLGGILKTLGDNINLVASLATGIAVASFLRWAGAGTVLAKAIQLTIASSKGLLALQMAAGLGNIASSTTTLASAWASLNVVMRANVFLFVAAAITGLVFALSKAGDEVQAFNKYVASNTTAMELGKNITDAYTATVADLSTNLASNSAVLDENTRKLLENYQAKLLQSGSTGVTTNKVRKGQGIVGSGTVYDLFGKPVENDWTRKTATRDGVSFTDKNGIAISDPLVIKALVRARNAGGDVRDVSKSPENLRRLLLSSGELGRRLDLDNAGVSLPVGQRETIQAEKNRLDFLINGARMNKSLPYDFKKTTGQVYKGGIEGPTPPPGISGDVPEKPDKKDKAGVKAFASDIDRALRAFSELDEKIKGTRATLAGFLDSSSSAIAAQAQASATDKVTDLENAFDPVKRVSGVIAMAKAMKLEASSYDVAKKALINKYAAQEEAQARAANDLSAGKFLADLREENGLRAKQIMAIADGSNALREANIQLEVEKQILGGSAENREVLTKKLREQLETQSRLNQAEEVGNAIQQSRMQLSTDKMVSGAYAAGGLTGTEIDQFKELAGYVNDLKNKGYDAGTINYLTELKQATLDQQYALGLVQADFEKVQQFAQDAADAITDGLRDAFKNSGDDGKNFFDRIKGVFKGIKDAALEMVLFQPLREFLTDSLSRSTSASGMGRGNQERLAQANAALNDIVQRGIDVVDNMIKDIEIPQLAAAGTDLTTAASQLMDSAQAIQSAANGSGSGLGVATIGDPATNMAGGTGGSMAAMVAITGSTAFQNVIGSQTKDAASTVAEAVGDEIVVIGRKDPINPTAKRQDRDYFSNLRKVFDSKQNWGDLKSGFSDIGDAFKSGTKGFSSKLDSVGKGIGKVGAVAGKAMAAYGMGSGIAKALGLGQGGQKIAGGAAAGFSVAGPIGGAIGAVAGGIAALFSGNKKKYANATVNVGANGRALVGAVNSRGGYDTANTLNAANGGASMFGQIAEQLGSYLTAGNYGTFGEAKKIKGDTKTFYSTTGRVDKKGRPVGTAGVDYVIGNDDVMQGFALRKQIQSGKFANLDPVYSTIANNSSNSLSQLSSDLDVGKSYLDFIEAAKTGSELQKQVDSLNKAFSTLNRTAGALGLDTAKLTRAYEKQKNAMREAFNYDINQQILQIKDPLLASYNDLVKSYEEAVGNAQAVGGDLNKVEELYGLKREEILKDYQERMTSTFRQTAKDMLDSLTASSASPLAPQTTFNNAQKNFSDLKNQINGGDYSGIDNLQTYAQNYLDTARTMSKSSADYFAIFNEVTDFLKMMSTSNFGIGPTNADNLPQLPGLSAVVDKLAKQNDDLVVATNNVGAAISEGNAGNEEYLAQINAGIQALLNQGYNGASLLSNGAIGGYGVNTSGISY